MARMASVYLPCISSMVAASVGAAIGRLRVLPRKCSAYAKGC
jgi:hypothetical protein